MKSFFTTTAILACLAAPLAADEISDTLQSAVDAYADGDAAYALEELEFAKQLLLAMKTDALVQFLPEAPDGWTREVNTDMNAGLAMMGGGTGAEAKYKNGSGDSFEITIMADNPLVGAMSGMIGNATLMGAKIVRVGREKFMVKDNEMNGMIEKRILVKAKGGDIEFMIDVLKTMDFRGLGKFGS